MFFLFIHLIIWTKTDVLAEDSNDPADYYYYYDTENTTAPVFLDIVNCTERCGSLEVLYSNKF